MENVAVSAITALIVSAVFCKVSAAYTFEVIDGHVKELIKMAKDSIKDAYSNK